MAEPEKTESQASKARLHRLIDAYPDNEVASLEQSLSGLLADRMRRILDSAPLDDEPDDDDFDGGLTEARAETPVPHEEVRRRLLGE